MISYVIPLDISEIKEIIELYNHCVFYLQNVDTNDLNYGRLKEVLRISDILLKDSRLNLIPSLYDEKITNHDFLKKLVLEVLNKSFYEQKLGDLLIRDFLDNSILLSYSCILYDIEKQKSKYNLSDIDVQIDLDSTFENHGGFANLKRKIIELNFIDKKEDRDYSYYNIYILSSIRHEICHFLQDEKFQQSKFTSFLDRLYLEFDYKAFECEKLYDLLHNFFPSEYHAIEFSYLTLYKDIEIGDYQNINTDILKRIILDKLKNLRFNELFNYFERYYPYCNLCPRLKKIIELACDLAVSGNERCCSLIYKLILKYQEIYRYIKNNFQYFEIDDDFLLNFDFNANYVINYKNMKNFIISYKFKDKNTNLVLDFEHDLKDKGYNDEDIYNVYYSYYMENKELFDVIFIQEYLKDNYKFRKKVRKRV